MRGEEVVLVAYKRLLLRGGELKVIVEKRGQERIPIVYEWPENKTRCDTEVVPFED